jgi:hypothetical protein
MLLGENNDLDHFERILSISQDIIYVSSKGRKLTPKHIGLGTTIHHATRSKYLVDLVHAAGHCVSYECVQKIDTSIAKSELERYKSNNNVVVPPNLVHGDFIQFAADNINILEETLDGKGQFNGTQCAAFQIGDREPIPSTVTTSIGKDRFLKTSIPSDFHELLSSGYQSSKRPSPVLPLVDLDWYKVNNSNEVIFDSKCKDLAWVQCRLTNASDQVIPAWTGFNQVVSNVESAVVKVGYMPIIPAPADDMDTVYTILSRCKYISESLGQQYTIITFDQALYCRAKEIVWLKEDEFDKTIIRLGGFHTAMNFMRAIGEHLESSGLKDIWVESGVFGENTAGHMMDGKAYNKAVRGHKLAVEALWRILWDRFLKWADENNKEIDSEVQLLADQITLAFRNRNMQLAEAEYERLVAVNHEVLGTIEQFEKDQMSKPTFKYWRNYMDMVSILLGFIRAEREGQWDLYLSLFARMLPWFSVYGHTNYSRWGPVYLADMRHLETTAPSVHHQFTAGRFSIKRTNKKFCQIAVDQALEHINRVSKVSGGIIGITRRDDARDKWCLTYNEKARIADATLHMFDLNVEDDVDAEWCHSDSGPTRLKRDEDDVTKIMNEFRRFDVFSEGGEFDENLICLSTRDVAPHDIMEEISSAFQIGVSQVENFVSTRLIDKSTDFFSKIPRHKNKTLASMYNVKVKAEKGKEQTVKADRDLLRRLFVASQSGRDIDLGNVLAHELSPVPLALAGTDSTLNKTTKSQLVDLLTDGTAIQNKLPTNKTKTCLLVDAPALIQAIGKPDNAKTFGDLGDAFSSNIFSRFGSVYSRVDVIFDRYLEDSIKAGTRTQRTGKIRPVRRVIDSKDVKLPQNWKQFITLPANKSELASFLSTTLIEKASTLNQLSQDHELVISGGFSDPLKVWSSRTRDLDMMRSNHEEADTRLILHTLDAHTNGYGRAVLSCRDTDVLVLALGFREKLMPEIWIASGTSQNRTFIPVHNIDLPPTIIDNIIAFHAITGCDTTSQFKGKGKKTAWKIFLKCPQLLNLLGSKELSPEVISGAEEFVCRLYTNEPFHSINDVRVRIFVQGKISLDALPPTKDALDKHIARANFQCLVWRQAIVPIQELPCPSSCGWSRKNGTLVPELMTLEPVPKVCKELVTCSCTTGCNPKRCGCRKRGFKSCTSACHCRGSCNDNDDNEGV